MPEINKRLFGFPQTGGGSLAHYAPGEYIPDDTDATDIIT